ncbi:hypothetical protein Tco_0026919 [Tanacetum coccineum]
MNIPTSPKVKDACTKHVFQGLDSTLTLTIGLRMVAGASQASEVPKSSHQLEIHWTGVSTEDQIKFLEISPSAVTSSTASSSNLQNIAFVSENTNSTNEVSTAYGVSNTSGHCSKHEQTSTSSYFLCLARLEMLAMISKKNKEVPKKNCRKPTFDGKKNLLVLIKPKWNATTATKQGTLQESVDQKKIIGGGMVGILEIEKEAELEIEDSQAELDKFGLGYGDYRYSGNLSYENEVFRVSLGNYLPSGPDIEIDDSQYTYGPEKTQPSEPESQTNELDTYALSFEEYESDVMMMYYRKIEGVRKQTWNNVQRVNKQNQFVPLAVQTRTGTNPVNAAKASSTNNFSTARQSVNRQTVLTSTALKVNTVQPMMSDVRSANVSHKTNSPSSRPFKRTTVLKTNLSNQKVYTSKVKEVSTVGEKWVIAVKSSASCKWRIPGYNNDIHSKYNGGSSLRNYSSFKDPLGRLKPKQAWWMFRLDRNKAYLADYRSHNGGPVAFGGSKGYITGKGKIKTENQANLHAGQQDTNQSSGTKDKVNEGDSEKEDESPQDCFELPIWHSYSSTIAPKSDNKRGGSREEEQVFLDDLAKLQMQEKEASEEAEALRKNLQKETENVVTQAEAAKSSSTNIFSTVSTTAKASGTNFVNTVSMPVSTASAAEGLSISETSNFQEDDSEIPPLEDIHEDATDGIFTHSSYDDEGAVADFTNLETVVNVSPIPTSRINPSHPSALILGDPTSTVQTRSKKISKLLRSKAGCCLGKKIVAFEIQKVWILVDMPYGKKAIGTKWVYRNKKDERGVVVPKVKPKLGLWYPRESSFDLESYSDSDYAGANLDRKSTTGGCQFLGRRLITWQCKKQTIVATSTTEAEYVAAASCCGQVLWIQNQMLDYGFNFMNTKIYIDNESTICIVKNPVYHSKTKHIAIRHHFIRDAYEKKLIQVLKIHTNDNVADLLTKAFDGKNSLVKHFEDMRLCRPSKEYFQETLVTKTYKNPSQSHTYSSNLSNLHSSLQALISLTDDLSLLSNMAALESCPKHNMIAYLEKTEGNVEFHEVIDFLQRSYISHALTVSPVVSTTFVEQFWTSAKSKTINNVRNITAKVAGKVVSISEASIRTDLIFDDADGITHYKSSYL